MVEVIEMKDLGVETHPTFKMHVSYTRAATELSQTLKCSQACTFVKAANCIFEPGNYFHFVCHIDCRDEFFENRKLDFYQPAVFTSQTHLKMFPNASSQKYGS